MLSSVKISESLYSSCCCNELNFEGTSTRWKLKIKLKIWQETTQSSSIPRIHIIGLRNSLVDFISRLGRDFFGYLPNVNRSEFQFDWMGPASRFQSAHLAGADDISAREHSTRSLGSIIEGSWIFHRLNTQRRYWFFCLVNESSTGATKRRENAEVSSAASSSPRTWHISLNSPDWTWLHIPAE